MGTRLSDGAGHRWGWASALVASLATAAITAGGCGDSSQAARRQNRRQGVTSGSGTRELPRSANEPVTRVQGRSAADENTTPLPPGWAEEIAEARRRAAAASRAVDPYEQIERNYPDGVVLRPQQRRSRDAWAAHPRAESPDSPRGSDARDSELRLPAQEPPPLGHLPTASTDYLVMLVVFLAPLVLIVPVAWFWHVLGAVRAAARPRPTPTRDAAPLTAARTAP